MSQQLIVLADRGEIPPALAEVTDLLRVMGNAGAHAGKQQITVPMTWGMRDLFCAIVEYVYVAPSKLAEFKKSLDSAGEYKTSK